MKRRELVRIYATGEERTYREVLPSDPDPEWVDELIAISKKICKAETMDEVDDFLNELEAHLAKRGTK